MNLIERYIQHIAQHLPEKSREDVLREVRSLVEDTLEDRSRASGRPIDEALTVEVLKEFGRPEKVAASYLPERYLISPRMYPIFWLVVRIVLYVLFAISLAELFIGMGRVNANFVQLMIQAVTGFASSGLSALGNIVLVFAILQYFMPELSKQIDKQDNWDPRKLEEIKSTDQISRFGLVFEITFSVIGLALFNFFPELLGIRFQQNGEWVYLQALSQTFFSYLPWINLVWGAGILLSLFLLIQGQWQTLTRWISIAIKTLSVGLAILMLSGPSLLDLNAASLAASGSFSLQNAERLVSIARLIFQGVLALIIVLDGLELVKTLYRQVKPQAPQTSQKPG